VSGKPTDVSDSRERRRAREALLADRNAALERRQKRRLILRLPTSMPLPRATVRPDRGA
jgi:hypothetical protein